MTVDYDSFTKIAGVEIQSMGILSKFGHVKEERNIYADFLRERGGQIFYWINPKVAIEARTIPPLNARHQPFRTTVGVLHEPVSLYRNPQACRQ